MEEEKAGFLKMDDFFAPSEQAKYMVNPRLGKRPMRAMGGHAARLVVQ
eukprot:COSAG06_NODE_66533_length_254_cov_0.664516_1_plen_47_part_10